MKIIISGYGRMGREVEALASAAGHDVLFRLNATEDWQQAGEALRQGDVVIDFSWPEAAEGNIVRAFNLHLPVVTGTTGWHEHLPEIKERCLAEGQALFVAANFSIGVNVMLCLSEKMAQLMDRFEQYRLSVEEVHHIHKLDSPSGTAIKLAEAVMAHSGKIERWSKGDDNDNNALPVTSRREGEVPGTHILRAESENDSLEIVHRAKSRRGFAAGALMAAEWMLGKQGFFSMKDLLEFTE